MLLVSIGSCKSPVEVDTVVIGGGLMGSAAAWHLSQDGQQVLLLEQQQAFYTFGSSFGEARIARSLGPPGDIFSYLHNRSVQETQKLIEFLQQRDSIDHHIEDVYTTSPVTYLRHVRQLSRVEQILQDQNDPYLFAQTADSALQLFQVSLPDTSILLREFKSYSGTMNPQNLIRKLHRAVRLHENEIWYGHRLDELKRQGNRYQLQITDYSTGKLKTIRCQKVVSAAGPYTSKVMEHLAPHFAQLITPKRVFLGFYTFSPEQWELLSTEQMSRLRSSFPLISSTAGTRVDSHFAMLEGLSKEGWPIIKIGGHFQRTPIENLNTIWQIPLSEHEIGWGKKHVLNYMKTLRLPLDKAVFVKGYSCVYSLTESEIPYVTTIDSLDNSLVVIGGMSGVGAKGAMTYGLVGANLLTGKSETSTMYKNLIRELGFPRLQKDLEALEVIPEL